MKRVYLSMLVLCAVHLAHGKASADDDALCIMRVIVAECGRLCSSAEGAAILYVFEARRRHVDVPLARMATRYSVAFNGRSRHPERAARMRALRLDEIPASIRRLVTAWLAGRRPPNTCTNAVHFAAPFVSSPLRRVQCTQPTVNHFYEAAR